ncbi:MAG: T9SS C-terminal target domain-containing protein [Ignavibacteriales bacterium]|nr:MAG: T9SS C-terminal target domain-containing protein [Ignavibacteriales bacterium]
MKSPYVLLRNLLMFGFVFILITLTNAGTRYKDIVFPSATITRNIQFGSNLAINGTTTSLYLDFFEPAGDTLKLRPLVIFIHGGSLISGNKGELETFCTDFAKRGFVAASIDYRLGIENPKGVKTILEALLRGVQDAKAAVRFFRSKADDYKIDTSKIFLEGSSAGSMIALHYAYLNQDEIPPDVDQAKWGDIEGTTGNSGFSSSIKGIINYCGAIIDPTWINENVPVGNFHGLLDPVVPPIDGISTDFGIRMYGGVTVSRIATQLGIYNQGAFFPQMAHGGNEDSLRLFSSNFLYTLLVLSASTPQDFTSFDLSEKSIKVLRYDTYTFTTTALDKSGNRIILPASMIEYSCDSRIGTIESSGVFTPTDHADSGYVYAKLNNVTVSCFVKVYDLKYFVIKPEYAVTDTLKSLQLSIDTYDADSVKLDLAITKFTLTSTDPYIGTIDSTGLFKGKTTGTTNVIAVCSNYRDTCTINVESASGIISFDELESINGWTFTNSNLDSLTVTLVTDQKSIGEASFKIDYKLTYDSQKSPYMIYLNKDIPVYGIPDSIYLDVKSDGRRHKLFYRFTDINSGIFKASGKKYLNDTLKFDKINTPMTTGLVQVSGSSALNYPLTFNRIEIQIAPDQVQGKITSGTIYIDNLRFKYPGSTTDVERKSSLPEMFRLEQNYPNPFNPRTNINYSIPDYAFVTLKIFNVLGEEVGVLINEYKNPGDYSLSFDASSLTSGVYIYSLETGALSINRKMLLIK